MTGSGYILLVEADRDQEALVLAALRASGFGNRIAVARDGIEALAILSGDARHSAHGTGRQPAAVVLDLDLPRIDGFELLRRIRADFRASLLPVIVFAKSGKSEDIHEAYRLGANSYVNKPDNAQEFERSMTRIARYWLALNELADSGIRF